MTELDDFLTSTISRQGAAEEAIHNGDPGPWLAMWSRREPVTLFGSMVPVMRGWDEVSPVIHWIGERFSDCTSHRYELVAAGASGDLAYTVGFQHTAASVHGVPAEPYVLRVTQVYRREDGEWRIVHRHGDPPPADQR